MGWYLVRPRYASASPSGWRVMRIWEHEIERDVEKVVDRIYAAVEEAGQG